VVSAGTGLELNLNRSITTADQPITLMPAAFDVNGVPLPVPTLTYVITPNPAPFAGPLPVVSGTTITPGVATEGSFTVTATDAADARTATANFAVVPPRIAGASTHGESYAHLAEVLDTIYAMRQPLIAARAANDVPLMTSLLQQMVLTWRTVDLDDLKISMPIVTSDQFPPTLDMMPGFGESPTPDDLIIKQLLRDSMADLKALTDALRANGGTLANLETLADQFSTRAARLDGHFVSRYGGIYNQPEYTLLLSHRIPAFYEAFMEEIAQASGLPRRTDPFPGFDGARRKPKSTLAELAVTQAVDFTVEKIIEGASATYKNAKQFAVDIGRQAAWTATAVLVANELRAAVLGGDIVAVISGASLSFHEFNDPLLNQAIVEAPVELLDPALSQVMIIGPDTVAAAGSAISGLYTNMKKAFSVGQNPLTNPQRYKNFNNAKKDISDMQKAIKGVGTSFGNLQKVVASAYQTASDVLGGCIFTSDPACNELIYENGIAPVFRYTPPPGYGALTGLPAAIIFIVQNMNTGLMYFATPEFMPSPALP